MKINTSWDLKRLYKSISDEKIKNDLDNISSSIDKFVAKWSKDKSYLENIDSLAQSLGEYDYLMRVYGIGGNPGYYIYLLNNLDLSDKKVIAKLNELDNFELEQSNRIRFFELSLAKIPSKIQKQVLISQKLINYRHFLRKIFDQANHLRTDEEEKILASLSDSAYSNWTRMVSRFLNQESGEVVIDGKKQTVPFNELVNQLQSTSKKNQRQCK